MNTELVSSYISDFAFVLSIFGITISWTVFVGRQSLINLTTSLYIATLIFIKLPYIQLINNYFTNTSALAGAKTVIFLIFTVIITIIIKRLMPREYLENRLESLPKKVFLAIGATVLITIICFTILPVNDLLPTDTPVKNLLGNEQIIFWLLLLPLIFLFMQ